jgi:hypothetical protein
MQPPARYSTEKIDEGNEEINKSAREEIEELRSGIFMIALNNV